MFSSKFACPVSGFTIEEIEPRLFSFNSPHGACPACDGLGMESFFDPALVVPDERATLAEGAVIDMTLEVRDKKQLEKVVSAIRRISGVRDIERVQGTGRGQQE